MFEKKISNSKKGKKLKKSFEFKDWKPLMKSALRAFPKIWWRVLVVNLVTLGMILVGFVIFFALGFLLFGSLSQAQDVFKTGNFGMVQVVFIGLGLFFLFLWMIVFGVIGKIAQIQVVKDYVHKKMKNPLMLYFKDCWIHFWDYIWLGFRIFWYVLWPSFLFGIVCLSIYGILFYFFPIMLEQEMGIDFEILGILGIVIFIFLFFLTIYRAVNASFSKIHLIETQGKAKSSLEFSLMAYQDNWWRIVMMFLMIFLLFTILPLVFIGILSSFFGAFEDILGLIWQIYSFFVLTPLLLIYTYFLMLHVGKQKKLK